MKKIIALSLLSVAVLGVASATGPKVTAPKAPTTIKCAVMGTETVNIAQATKNKMYADFKGKRYFFCCNGCPAKFKADPAKYEKSASMVIPSGKKMKGAKKAA